ncbi:DUF4367 domain-containing protein [Candidatus Saccharibacteria bacterium]|nr:DUF4367 domain-containing protein [Candidatus Saccharibacteria bacterium]
MGVKENTITINGRVYDAKTGKPVSIKSTNTASASVKVIKPTKVLPKIQKATTTDNKQVSMAQSTNIKKVAIRTTGTVSSAMHRRTERTKTLSRATVKKPAQTKTARTISGTIKQPSKIVVHSKGKEIIKPKPTIVRSNRINHFSKTSVTVVHKTNIPVVNAPRQKVKHTTKLKSYDISNTPPMPQQKTTQYQIKNLPISDNIFNQALRSATSHKNTHKIPTKNNRLGKIGLIGLSVLILGVFFSYQNAPRIALHKAKTTIGFDAKIPNYNPAGFRRIGPVQYQRGMVVLNFQSNSDDRQYAVTQTSTDIDNADIPSKYLDGVSKDYQTTNVKGQTVYIYNNSRATWINQGVWYTIDGNANLGKDQLVNIVASI